MNLRLLGLSAMLAVAACQHPVALSSQVDWVAHSQEWQHQAQEVFTQATAHAKQMAERYQTEQWVVVMDLDETVLNNVHYQVNQQRGQHYSPQSWRSWTAQQSATLVPGAHAYIRQVRALGGLVVFVTNRRDVEQLSTEHNLAALGLKRGDDFQLLMTRATPHASSSKEARFKMVPALLHMMGYASPQVVAYVGDAMGDKPRQLKGARFFCINQGGMYGEPCAQTGVPPKTLAN
jgi:5'-nucleotidase (lipoprotein e(P4) family)